MPCEKFNLILLGAVREGRGKIENSWLFRKHETLPYIPNFYYSIIYAGAHDFHATSDYNLCYYI